MNTRRLVVMCGWACLVSSLLGTLGQAASTVDALVYGTLLDNDSVLWEVAESGSWAVAQNNEGTDEDIDGPVADAYSLATASVGEAFAVAGTEPGYVAAYVAAAPGPGRSARAYASPYQVVRIQAIEDGFQEFTVEFTMEGLLTTQSVGEWAFADGSLGVSLSGGANPEPVYFEYYVENGDSLALPTEPTYLTASGVLEAGQSYELWFGVDASVEAYAIPAPGALLLGGIGTGLIGLLRRRRVV